MTAALPMGSNKITGMAEPTVSTDGATKNYVDTTTAAFFSTGDVKLTLKTVADSGWLLFDDGTFGSASSGSSNSNSANNLALFTLLFNSPFTDANLPLLTSGGGATTRAAQVSASAAWAANCRMSLPKTLGRALGVAGSGSGLTARPLGSIVGAETVNISLAQLPTGITSNVSDFAGNNVVTTTGTPTGATFTTGGGAVTVQSSSGVFSAATLRGTSTNTTGAATSIMQPEVFLNAMVKI